MMSEYFSSIKHTQNPPCTQYNKDIHKCQFLFGFSRVNNNLIKYFILLPVHILPVHMFQTASLPRYLNYHLNVQFPVHTSKISVPHLA